MNSMRSDVFYYCHSIGNSILMKVEPLDVLKVQGYKYGYYKNRYKR